VFENTVLIKGEELAGTWRKLHNDELHKLNASPNITAIKKSRKWHGRVRSAHYRDKKCIQNFSLKTWSGGTTLESVRQKWTLKK